MASRVALRIIRDAFEKLSESRSESISAITPMLVAWAIEGEDGDQYVDRPDITGLTIKSWEYEFLTSLFRSTDWRFLDSLVPPLAPPSLQYFDSGSNPGPYIAVTNERSEIVRALASKIKADMTVSKEKTTVGLNNGMLGQQSSGLSGASSLPPGDLESYKDPYRRDLLAAQSQYNQQFNAQNAQLNTMAAYYQKNLENEIYSNGAMKTMREFVEAADGYPLSKPNQPKVSSPKTPPVETDPLTDAPRMVAI